MRKLINFLLRPISLERLQKVNRSNSLSIIQNAYAELNLKFDSTKQIFWIVVIAEDEFKAKAEFKA